MAAEPLSGRLELTWTNKDKRLLAYEDGSYIWTDPADYRVAEVRLLDDAGTIGDVHPVKQRAADNLLIRGDALNALTSLTKLPEFADEYVGKVKLAYLDPPFNTQQSFLQYDDALEHSVWLTMMRDRLLQVQRLLAPEGSAWVHCDDYEQHRLRVLMDEVFGTSQFVATVVWQKRYSRDNRPAIGPVHDFIHVYAPSGTDWKKVRNRVARDARSARHYRNPNNDPNGPWRSIPLDVQAGHATASQFYEITAPDGTVHAPSPGRAWSLTKPRMEAAVLEGRVYFGRTGRAKPALIRYLKEDQGLVPWSWWPHEEVGHNDESKKELLALFPELEPFDTPKPERLLERIVSIATDPGDVVLDCFLGSGTTAAVAHKMGRRWVGVERSSETLDVFALPRLKRVVAGEDPGGITDAAGWAGGGGFRVLDVAKSMFEEDNGTVVVAGWAADGKLAEATAAQLGFSYEPDAPFVGRRGRSRLAVIDGLVNPGVAEVLVSALPEGELLTLCGTAVDPATRQALRDLRRGSSVRKIPSSILAEYRRPRWVAEGAGA